MKKKEQLIIIVCECGKYIEFKPNFYTIIGLHILQCYKMRCEKCGRLYNVKIEVKEYEIQSRE